eukprot:Gb_22307 [translate_table: standard]
MSNCALIPTDAGCNTISLQYDAGASLILVAARSIYGQQGTCTVKILERERLGGKVGNFWHLAVGEEREGHNQEEQNRSARRKIARTSELQRRKERREEGPSEGQSWLARRGKRQACRKEGKRRIDLEEKKRVQAKRRPWSGRQV